MNVSAGLVVYQIELFKDKITNADTRGIIDCIGTSFISNSFLVNATKVNIRFKSTFFLHLDVCDAF